MTNSRTNPGIAKLVESVTSMIKAVTDNEEAVTVTCIAGTQGNVIIEVRIDFNDMSYAIGVNGRTIDAIRTILNTQCKKYNLRYQLSVDAHPTEGACLVRS